MNYLAGGKNVEKKSGGILACEEECGILAPSGSQFDIQVNGSSVRRSLKALVAQQKATSRKAKHGTNKT
jgi:hypothetical protein